MSSSGRSTTAAGAVSGGYPPQLIRSWMRFRVTSTSFPPRVVMFDPRRVKLILRNNDPNSRSFICAWNPNPNSNPNAAAGQANITVAPGEELVIMGNPRVWIAAPTVDGNATEIDVYVETYA